MNRNEFLSALAENFPFMGIEKQVDGKIFADIFEKSTNGLMSFCGRPMLSDVETSDFFLQLEKTLDVHAEKNPLRCVDIVCFIGINAVLRPNDLTLCYLRSKSIAMLVTKYLQRAIEKGNHLTLKHCLLLANMAFEHRKKEAGEVIEKELLPKVVPENVYVLSREHEMALLESYRYVWKDNPNMINIATRFVI